MLVEAVFRGALGRWFGVLFWFLLLARWARCCTASPRCGARRAKHASACPKAPQAARTMLAILDWPVAQLMTLALALVGNFDSVLTAWRDAGGAGYTGDTRFLAAAARERAQSNWPRSDWTTDTEYGTDGGGAVARVPGLPELRDAMSLVWRILLLWLAVLALFVIAGWVA